MSLISTCEPVFQYESAISRLVTTADSGKPLPIGLPSVTISGVTPPSFNKSFKFTQFNAATHLISPHVTADAAKANLHLVGNAECTMLATMFVDFLEVIIRRYHLSFSGGGDKLYIHFK